MTSPLLLVWRSVRELCKLFAKNCHESPGKRAFITAARTQEVYRKGLSHVMVEFVLVFGALQILAFDQTLDALFNKHGRRLKSI